MGRSEGDGWRSWNDVAGKAVFEILIVAVGVLLALAVDQWRERAEQRKLADEARFALRAEILANREAAIARLRRTAELYAQTVAQPDQAGQFVFERRNRPLFVTDSAWTMAVETGAVRWLTPAERASFSEIYAGQQRARDVALEEMARWTELGGFPPNPGATASDANRNLTLRVWQAWVHRVQFALCVNVGRYERALGATVTEAQLLAFCAERRPDEDPASIYREWQKLGWVSATAPRTLASGGPSGNSTAVTD